MNLDGRWIGEPSRGMEETEGAAFWIVELEGDITATLNLMLS